MIRQLRDWLTQTTWARRFRQGGDYTWMREPLARRYINACITGSEDLWPMDWFRSRYAETPFERGLSLGCGDGLLERDVMRKGICRSIAGIDFSASAIAQARAHASEEGLSGIEYRRADMNHLELEEDSFDIVFFHQSLHHVENLDGCLAEVKKALRPGGKIYLDEYIGPSRSDWRPELMADAEAAYRRLPAAFKRRRRLTAPIDWRDPSEAIRSSEIVPALKRHFSIFERRDYGGNLLAMIHPYLRHERLREPEGERVVARLIAAEKELLTRGAPSYYAVLIGEI